MKQTFGRRGTRLSFVRLSSMIWTRTKSRLPPRDSCPDFMHITWSASTGYDGTIGRPVRASARPLTSQFTYISPSHTSRPSWTINTEPPPLHSIHVINDIHTPLDQSSIRPNPRSSQGQRPPLVISRRVWQLFFPGPERHRTSAPIPSRAPKPETIPAGPGKITPTAPGRDTVPI